MTSLVASTALRVGLPACNLFPVAQLGVGYVRTLREPFSEATAIAVGGIDATNAQALCNAGAQRVVFGALDQIPSRADSAGFIWSLQ